VTLFDAALFIFLLFLALSGFAMGFVKAVAVVGGLFVGCLIGAALYLPASRTFFPWVQDPSVAQMLAFGTLALLVLFVFDYSGDRATQVVRRLHLQILNRPLGIVPGVLYGIFLAGLALAIMAPFGLFARERHESKVATWVETWSAPIVNLLPPPWSHGGDPGSPGAPEPVPDAPLTV